MSFRNTEGERSVIQEVLYYAQIATTVIFKDFSYEFQPAIDSPFREGDTVCFNGVEKDVA